MIIEVSHLSPSSRFGRQNKTVLFFHNILVITYSKLYTIDYTQRSKSTVEPTWTKYVLYLIVTVSISYIQVKFLKHILMLMYRIIKKILSVNASNNILDDMCV